MLQGGVLTNKRTHAPNEWEVKESKGVYLLGTDRRMRGGGFKIGKRLTIDDALPHTRWHHPHRIYTLCTFIL